LSRRLGWLTEHDVERTKNLFKKAGLPISGPQLGTEKYMQLMGLDKKVADGKIRFVLLKQLGQAVITDSVPVELLAQTLECCSA
jgi:3-dehydroquinate synthase